MKKRMLPVLLLVLCLAVLPGCACEHEWVEADCLNPKTCSLCEEVEGQPLGHSWQDATCAAPRTCKSCGTTEGEALPHSFADATCTAPKTCSVCAATEGEALGHSWQDATCTAPKTCTVCNAAEGEALGHLWVDATYSTPKTCSACAVTEGDVLVRTDLGLNSDQMAVGMSQVLQAIGCDLKYLGNDADGWPVFDLVLTDGTATGANVTFEPTADGKLVYAIAIYTDDINNTGAVSMLGAASTVTLVGLDENFDIDLYLQTLQGQPEMVDGMAVYYMESCGLSVEMQVSTDLALIWIYPVEG